ncbi:MAG: T9SS type A sorting domain-containing protein [Ignavibacteria bacterium]|nr:T9SS type A sorting domain-containing protein [Ignavibacteria bacterium]
MKKFLLLLILVLLAQLEIFSQANKPIPITVGPKPTYVNGFFNFLVNDYRLIVTTLGIDKNFNGKEDSGDVKPALYQISLNQIMNGNFTGSLLTELDFGSLPFPTRIAIDNIGNFAYIPNKLTISKILLESGDIITTINPFSKLNLPPDAYISSVDFVNGYLFLSVRAKNYNNFFIVKESTLDIIFETATEPNPQQSVVVGNYLFILCEGTLGQNNSKLWVYEIKSFDQWEIAFVKEFEIGDTGNHLRKVGNDKLLITMNGSHQIHILNVTTLQIEKTIQLPTSGYDGPRESGIIGDKTIVTTAYDGNLYIFDTNGNQLGRISIANKLEGIFTYTFPNPNMNFSIVVATSPFLPNYQPNDKIYLFVNFLSNVENNIFLNNFKIFPNPANDYIVLSLNSDSEFPTKLSIFDKLGNKIKEFNFSFVGKDLLIPISDLPSGSYLAKIYGTNVVQTLPFVVVK